MCFLMILPPMTRFSGSGCTIFDTLLSTNNRLCGIGWSNVQLYGWAGQVCTFDSICKNWSLSYFFKTLFNDIRCWVVPSIQTIEEKEIQWDWQEYWKEPSLSEIVTFKKFTWGPAPRPGQCTVVVLIQTIQSCVNAYCLAMRCTKLGRTTGQFEITSSEINSKMWRTKLVKSYLGI